MTSVCLVIFLALSYFIIFIHQTLSYYIASLLLFLHSQVLSLVTISLLWYYIEFGSFLCCIISVHQRVSDIYQSSRTNDNNCKEIFVHKVKFKFICALFDNCSQVYATFLVDSGPYLIGSNYALLHCTCTFKIKYLFNTPEPLWYKLWFETRGTRTGTGDEGTRVSEIGEMGFQE